MNSVAYEANKIAHVSLNNRIEPGFTGFIVAYERPLERGKNSHMGDRSVETAWTGVTGRFKA